MKPSARSKRSLRTNKSSLRPQIPGVWKKRRSTLRVWRLCSLKQSVTSRRSRKSVRRKCRISSPRLKLRWQSRREEHSWWSLSRRGSGTCLKGIWNLQMRRLLGCWAKSMRWRSRPSNLSKTMQLQKRPRKNSSKTLMIFSKISRLSWKHLSRKKISS